MRVVAVQDGDHGTVRINSNSTLTYEVEADYTGDDQFTYTASDGNGGEAQATVAVTVKQVNKPPVATVTSTEFRNSIAMDFVLIPAGSFMMGSNENSEEKPVHRVLITQPFYMGKYEVTQAQWESVMGSNPSNFKGSNLPVEQVSWDDVDTFIRRLNQREGGTRYRLPTEADWEYACRAGTTGDYAGNNLDVMGWYDANAGSKTHPVGRKQPNAFGLYDMHGNVSEWCSDRYDSDYYQQSPGSNPKGSSSGSLRVVRGGSWDFIAGYCRSAYRNGGSPGIRYGSLGFRLVRTAD